MTAIPFGRMALAGVSAPWRFWGYLALIALAELLTAVVNTYAGLALHAALLVALTIHGSLANDPSERNLALALTLAPLIRLLSLSLPLTRFPQIAWYPMVAAPLLLATWLIIRQLGLTRTTLGLRPGNLLVELLLAGGGFGLGAIEYVILRPNSLVAEISWWALWLPALSLVLFTGFNEELIFRGLLQPLATPVLSRAAILFVALLFAVLHIGYLSLTDFVFVFLVGMVFGQVVRWSGSILGVTLAHGLTNVTLFLLMPSAAAAPASMLATVMPWLVWGGTSAALVALAILWMRAVSGQIAAVPAAREGIPVQLRQVRRRLGLSYSELAVRTGLPVRLLAELEHGMRPAAPDVVARLAQGLNLAL